MTQFNIPQLLRRFMSSGVIVLLLVATLLTGRSAAAQGTTGSITGTVTDETGAAVPGATVTVTQTSTNDVHTTATSDSGFYTVPQLPPGKYRVSLEKGGFNRFEQSDITLTINQTAQINAQLRVGSAQEAVTVTSASPIIQTDGGGGSRKSERTKTNVPAPSAVAACASCSRPRSSERASASNGAAASRSSIAGFGVTPAIGTGSRNSYGGVGFSLDGVQTKSGTLQRGLAETASLDAIGEFKTLTTGAPAEFNQPAQIVVVTQSGANAIHGGVFEFNRGRGTSAKQYFAGAWRAPLTSATSTEGISPGPSFFRISMMVGTSRSSSSRTRASTYAVSTRQ